MRIIENAREDVVASDHFDIEGTKTAMPQTQAATKGMMTSGLQTPALVCPPPGPRPPAQSRTIRETIASHATARLPLLDSIATETDAKIRMPPLTREKNAASLIHSGLLPCTSALLFAGTLSTSRMSQRCTRQ